MKYKTGVSRMPIVLADKKTVIMQISMGNEERNDLPLIKIENHFLKGKLGSILTPENSRKQGSSGNNGL